MLNVSLVNTAFNNNKNIIDMYFNVTVLLCLIYCSDKVLAFHNFARRRTEGSIYHSLSLYIYIIYLLYLYSVDTAIR